MSRGPGRIEAAIAAIFEAEPDQYFTIEDLAQRLYPGINRVDKKHRVAVLRAGRNVASRLWWAAQRRQAPGGQMVFFNLLNVRSYALGRLRVDFSQNDMSDDDLVRLIEDPHCRFSHWDHVQPWGGMGAARGNPARRAGRGYGAKGPADRRLAGLGFPAVRRTGAGISLRKIERPEIGSVLSRSRYPHF